MVAHAQEPTLRDKTVHSIQRQRIGVLASPKVTFD